MIKNYLLTTIRFLKRNKLYSTINIAGLTLGLTCSIVIFLIIQFELSFDQSHKEPEKIFRITHEEIKNDEMTYSSGVPYPLTKVFESEFSGIEYQTIVDQNFRAPLINIRKENGSIAKFIPENPLFIGKDYFKIFSYEVIKGEISAIFDNPSGVVLSKSLAEKFFGSVDIIGRTIIADDKSLEVSAVVNDPALNSSFQFNYFRALPADRGNDNWTSISSAVQYFIKLNSVEAKNLIESRFEQIENKYLSEEDAANINFSLQPLLMIHYDDRYFNFGEPITSKQQLLALGVIALLIILISSINYINLSTALGLNRAAEVGIRKVFGSSRFELAVKFLIESSLITFTAFVVSIIAVQFALPIFNDTFGFNADIKYLDPLVTAGYLIGAFLLMTFVSGFYPAIFVSKFNPIRAIKNSLELKSNQKISLRRILVIFQFGISQALLIATLVVINQMNYFENADMGFEKESVIQIALGDRRDENLNTLKAKLNSESFVSSVTFSNTGTASINVWNGSFELTGSDDIKEGNLQIKFVDEDFVETYGLKLATGESSSKGTQTVQYIVNESFANLVGYGDSYSELIGNQLVVWDNSGPIIGVVHDFVTTSLHSKIQPVALCFNKNRFSQGAVKLNTSNIGGALEKIEEHWSSVWPDDIFEYDFFDEAIKQQYEKEQNLSKVLSMFSIIALIIGSLGLFGLASFIVERRVKEIGIRKVLGASALQILTLFNKEFFFMLIWGFVIFAPVAYYFMNNWLETFAYRIDISPFVFIFTFTVTAVIALLTISIRAIRAAFINPINALKYE